MQSVAAGTVALLLAAATLPAAATTTTFEVPASIDSTGSVDVTQKLVAFFASVPDGSVVVFPAGAQYNAEGSLLFQNRNNLTFEGNGTRIFADSWAGEGHKHMWFQGGSNIVIRDLWVQGSNIFGGTQDVAYWPSKQYEHGFTFHGVTGVELDNVTVTKTFGDFAYFGGYRDTPTTDVWVHDSTFLSNGRQGISLTSARNVLIEANVIANVRRSIFDFEPGGDRVVEDVVVRNNDVGPGRLLFVSAGGGGAVNDVEISGNRLVGKQFDLDVATPEGQRRSGWQILNNTSDRKGVVVNGVLELRRVDRAKVQGNDIGPVSGPLVGAVDSCSISVGGNVLGAGAVGLVKTGTYVC